MTIDERIERLEFQNAAYVEQRRKDWEEYLVRERDMKSHIEAIWKRMEDRDRLFREEQAERDRIYKQEQSERDRVYKREQKERDEIMDKRIGDLVSSIGELCRRLDGTKTS